SSAQLLIPAGGHILFAGLYWTGLQKKGDVVKGTNGYTGVPNNPPNAAALDQVKFKVPGSATYSSLTASQVDTGPIANSSGYTAFRDVTAQVIAAGSGAYTVADVQTGTGGNSFAGWSLVVAYADAGEPLRNLSVFDGLRIVSGTTSADIALSGFKTPASGPVRTTVGVVAAEGDAGLSGDYLTLNDRRLTDAVHQPDNTENSTIADRGALVTTKTPNWNNQLGYDSSLFTADGFLANNATSAILRAKTSGDTYATQAVTFSTELFSPNVNFVKSAEVVGGGDPKPGATIRYTITATNNGDSSATNVIFTDPIPPQMTLSAGPTVSDGVGDASTSGSTITARLGAGASATAGGTLAPGASTTVTFDADILPDRPLGMVIDNTATLSFVAPDLGLPISTVASAEITVNYPDPGIVKTFKTSSSNQYTFDLTVTNEGTIPTTDPVSVDDLLGAAGTLVSISGDGWSCPGGVPPCTRTTSPDALAPGESYPPLEVVASYPPGSDVENSATVSGGGQPTGTGSPALLNDSSSVAPGVSLTAELLLSKIALAGTVDVLEETAFRLEVRNPGPATATGATVTDTLPAGLTLVSATASQGACTDAPGAGDTTEITCDIGGLEVGDSAQITVTTRPTETLAGTTVTNSASATSSTTTTPATATADVDVRPATDLSVSKTVTPTSLNLGDLVTYEVTATNEGEAAATDVQIVDSLPAAIDPDSAVIDPGAGGSCTRTGATISCIWPGDTATAAQRTVSITANVLGSVPAPERAAINRASVSSLTADVNPANDIATALLIVLPLADVHVNASGPGTILSGGTATLTFTAGNNGPTTATDTSTTITIPSGLTVVSLPPECVLVGSTVTCATGALAEGDTVTHEIVVRADTSLTNATRVPEATIVSPDVPDPVEANNTDVAPLVAGPVADLSVTKSVDAASVAPGGTVSFTIAVANDGPSTSDGASVTDTLPAGLSAVSATSSAETPCVISGRAISCPAGEIVAGSSLEIIVVATAAADRAGSTLVNRVKLTPGAQLDPQPGNDEAHASVKVSVTPQTRARMRITARSNPTTTHPRGTVRLVAAMRNLSKDMANGVRACVTIPARLAYRSSTGRRIGSRVCWTLGRIGAGSSRTVSYLALARTTGTATATATSTAYNATSVRDTTSVRIRRLPPAPSFTG
ncbi:MAG: DUF11 domain-containing protein, partial [Actinobacteria bacterium]|nr:DUF11 domain-containing protein [Actinomycetota bacterium]